MSAAAPAPRFPPHSELRAELVRRVDDYFRTTGLPKHGGARIVGKTAVALAWLAASYLLLLLWAGSPWTAVPLAVSLGLATAGVGFMIQHDGGHSAYAGSPQGNRAAAWTLDLVGASSYVWHFKHVIVHHHATNVDGADEDIDGAPFLRLAPAQPRKWYHRFQHWYAWPLLAFLVPKWQFWDDFAALARGRIGRLRLPRPKGRDLVVFAGGKAAFAAYAFVLPLALGHSLGAVLGVYAIAMAVAGIWLSIVFQLAHCVEEAEFPDLPDRGERMTRPWVEHQLATTVDFAPDSAFLTWYLGGLNFQVEHHLFPRISHVHYPALSKIVRRTCEERGIAHRQHRSVPTAIASHARHLRRMGRG